MEEQTFAAAWEHYSSSESQEIHRNMSNSEYIYFAESADLSGKVLFRMRGGELFRGKVVNSTLAIGKVIDGNISKKTKFHLEMEEKTWRFTIFGTVKSFNKKVLYEEVSLVEDGSWTGWSKSGNKTFKGKWESNGDFTGVIEAPPMRWRGRFGSEGLEGLGKFTIGNLTYQGHFLRGKPHGMGQSIKGWQLITGKWQEGKLVHMTSSYEGQSNNSCYHGWGILEGSGRSYKGYFSHGKYEGLGIFQTQNFKIIGTFHAGQPHGFCTYTTKEVTYVGSFKQGKRHGKGLLQWPNLTYEGEFNSGFMPGQDEHAAKTNSYTGQFKEGKFDGHGMLKLPKFIYIGEFAKGKLNGHGSISYSDGITKTGVFRDNKLL